MSDRYALINNESRVILFADKSQVDNTEASFLWVKVPSGIRVNIGYKYDHKTGFFTRVRKPLQEEKRELLNVVNNIYTQKMRALTSGFSDFEIMTFPRQDLELYIMQHGDQSQQNDIIFFNALAKARGIPFKDLMSKAAIKSKHFAYAAGTITGYRQRYEDRIAACNSHEVLDEIEEHVKKWGDS